MKNPNDCLKFPTCSANLCPLDHSLKVRNWFPGEAFCTSRTYGQTRWVRKQRKLSRKCPRTWDGVAMTIHDLISISRPRDISPEQRKVLQERARIARSAKN